MHHCLPIEAGLFLKQFPYVAAGDGPGAIAVFPHIRETLEDIHSARWCHRWLRRFSKTGARVYIVGRRTDLPDGYSTQDMAHDYARVLRTCIGPAGIIGFSLGGLIAQHLAVEHPDIVTALVLAVSGYRIAPEQHPLLLRWTNLARLHRWPELYQDIAALMHSGIGADREDLTSFYCAPALQRIPENPRRFIISLQASLQHNTHLSLGRIAARTLVIGGSADPLFPEPILSATQRRIPHSRLAIIENAGHGAFDEHKRAFDRQVHAFLHTH